MEVAHLACSKVTGEVLAAATMDKLVIVLLMEGQDPAARQVTNSLLLEQLAHKAHKALLVPHCKVVIAQAMPTAEAEVADIGVAVAVVTLNHIPWQVVAVAVDS